MTFKISPATAAVIARFHKNDPPLSTQHIFQCVLDAYRADAEAHVAVLEKRLVEMGELTKGESRITGYSIPYPVPDDPIGEPLCIYMQGGEPFVHARLARAIQNQGRELLAQQQQSTAAAQAAIADYGKVLEERDQLREQLKEAKLALEYSNTVEKDERDELKSAVEDLTFERDQLRAKAAAFDEVVAAHIQNRIHSSIDKIIAHYLNDQPS